MDETTLTLKAACPATLIPAGDRVVLPAGTQVMVTQTLGGAVTVRARGMLYRIMGEGLAALEEDFVAAALGGGRSGEETATSGITAGALEETAVWAALRECYDPEIPLNIVDLGLIYGVSLMPGDGGKTRVEVTMTLTAQGCGMGPVIAEDAKRRVEALPQVESARVEIVWEPAWTPQRISLEGRQRLGLE